MNKNERFFGLKFFFRCRLYAFCTGFDSDLRPFLHGISHAGAHVVGARMNPMQTPVKVMLDYQ